jgi:hypothetical protein
MGGVVFILLIIFLLGNRSMINLFDFHLSKIFAAKLRLKILWRGLIILSIILSGCGKDSPTAVQVSQLVFGNLNNSYKMVSESSSEYLYEFKINSEVINIGKEVANNVRVRIEFSNQNGLPLHMEFFDLGDIYPDSIKPFSREGSFSTNKLSVLTDVYLFIVENST